MLANALLDIVTSHHIPDRTQPQLDPATVFRLFHVVGGCAKQAVVRFRCAPGLAAAALHWPARFASPHYWNSFLIRLLQTNTDIGTRNQTMVETSTPRSIQRAHSAGPDLQLSRGMSLLVAMAIVAALYVA